MLFCLICEYFSTFICSLNKLLSFNAYSKIKAILNGDWQQHTVWLIIWFHPCFMLFYLLLMQCYFPFLHRHHGIVRFHSFLSLLSSFFYKINYLHCTLSHHCTFPEVPSAFSRVFAFSLCLLLLPLFTRFSITRNWKKYAAWLSA